MTPDTPRETPLVLIVDDERDIADLLESYFRLEGYRTLAAYDAAGAVAAARRAPDVILLDVNLPDADGFSVCREVRELVTCPIIFLTARVEDADALAGFAAGGDDYVTKPFSLDVLGARVRAQLARDRRRLDRATVRFAGGVAVDLARREVRVGEKDPRVAELARKAGIELVVERAGLPERVLADGRALSRIADNLVANAMRHAHDEARLSLSWEDGTLTLAVADNGPGFAEAALAHAAEPFWGESKGTDGHLGLGLYVARTLAERHGGRLELSNRAEGGALARARVLAPEAPQGDEKATSR